MDIETSLRAKKLNTLLQNQGYASVEDFINGRGLDSICPGICISPDCDGVFDVEGDQETGWCFECETNTVVAFFILADVI
jgi:hypothetical protein